jgi:hypothetical protein
MGDDPVAWESLPQDIVLAAGWCDHAALVPRRGPLAGTRPPRVVYLSEGLLRAIHRRVSTEDPVYRSFVPHHTFRREDSRPMTPGEVTELRFGLLPVSAFVRAGHRMRLAIAGADKDTFVRIPDSGPPTITVHRNSVHASCVELPVTSRSTEGRTSPRGRDHPRPPP